VKAGVLPATGLFQTAVFWAGLLFYAGLLCWGGAEFFLQGADSDDSVAFRVEASVMSPASFPVLSEVLAPEEDGWPSLIAGSPGQDTLAVEEESLECRRHTFPCRAFHSFGVSLKYHVSSPGKVASSDQTLPMSLPAEGTAQTDDRKNRNIHSPSSCYEIGDRVWPDLFDQRGPDIRLGKAVYCLSTSIPVTWDFLKFLKIYKNFPSSSNDVGFPLSLSSVTWTISVPSVSQATVPIILLLSSSAFWLSPAITVPSAFPSILIPSTSPVTLLLSLSQKIPDQSRFLEIQETFILSASQAFSIKSIHIQFIDILSSTEILIISEYSKSFKFLLNQTALLHTSYSVILTCLSIHLQMVHQVYFKIPVSLPILDSNSFASFQSSQPYPAKDVHVGFLKISVCTSIARSYDIVSFVAMDRREDDMGVRIVWLVDELIIQIVYGFPKHHPLYTTYFYGGVPASSNCHKNITNVTVPATELSRHQLGMHGLNRKLHLGSYPEIIYPRSCRTYSVTIMVCKIWWKVRVTGLDIKEDMGQSFMDRIIYDSALFNRAVAEQLVKVYSYYGNQQIFDNNTAQLVAEIQVLAPPIKSLHERSPIYPDTRLASELLTERLNDEFWDACLDSAEIVKIPDASGRRDLATYISTNIGRLDDNLFKLVSPSGPLNHALQNAIFKTHNDLVTYTNLVDPTINNFEKLPGTLTISSWKDEMDSLKQKFRNASITHNPDGTLRIDSLKGVQRLPEGISLTLSRQIFQRRREHLTWFALYPRLKTDFIELKESTANNIFDKIASEFEKFHVITGNPRHDQEFSDMLDSYVSVSQDGFVALGSWLILSVSQLPNVSHPSRILQLWDIISVSCDDKDIKGAVDTLIPGDIYCVNRTDLGPEYLVYTLSHEDSHTWQLSLMDLSRMGSWLATCLLGKIRDKLGAKVHNLGNMSRWISGGQKQSFAEDFASRFSDTLGTRLTGLTGAIDRETWINVNLPMIGIVKKPNPEFDSFVASLISGGLEV
jgi:hypothetical protein